MVDENGNTILKEKFPPKRLDSFHSSIATLSLVPVPLMP